MSLPGRWRFGRDRIVRLQSKVIDMASVPHISQNPDVRFLGHTAWRCDPGLMAGINWFRRTEYIRAASVDRHRGVEGSGRH